MNRNIICLFVVQRPVQLTKLPICLIMLSRSVIVQRLDKQLCSDLMIFLAKIRNTSLALFVISVIRNLLYNYIRIITIELSIRCCLLLYL